MRRHSFEEVMQLDQALQFLAGYDVTGGNILMPESHEEIIELSKKIANRFNYFKKLIRSGECTFDYIKYQVLDKNGAFPQPKEVDITDPNQVTKWIEEEKQLIEEEEQAKENIKNMVGSLLSGIMPLKAETEMPQPTPTEIPKPKKRRSKKNKTQ